MPKSLVGTALLTARFCALVLSAGCIPTPLTIPPHVPNAKHARVAMGVSGGAGQIWGPLEPEEGCGNPEVEGWHAGGRSCLTHGTAFELHGGPRLRYGTVLSLSGWDVSISPALRGVLVDRPHHVLAATISASPLSGLAELGYAYRVTPWLAVHAQPQVGIGGAPAAFVAYAPVGVTLEPHKRFFMFGQMVPGMLHGRGDTFFTAQGVLGLGTSFGSPRKSYDEGVPAMLLNEDLRRARFAKRDLSKRTFEGSDLRGADLRKANLSAAVLDNVDARGANFAWAILDRASLRRADLRSAKLAGASLRGADLSWALLGGTNLNHARIEGADLRFAEGLVQRQLDRACGDGTTRVRPGLVVYGCAD